MFAAKQAEARGSALRWLAIVIAIAVFAYFYFAAR